VYDAAPKGTWWNYDNCQSRQEGATASRFGLYPLSTDGATQNFPLGAPVNSLSRMQGIGTPYRYAGTTSGVLFRRAGNGQGAFTQIANGLSGNRLSMSPYRPANSSSPWQFIADDTKLVKDNGILAAVENWGINPPTQPALIAPVAPGLLNIELFDENSDSSFTLSNITGDAPLKRVSGFLTSAITAPGVQSVFVGLYAITSISRTGDVSTVNYSGALPTGMRVAINVNPGSDQSFAATSAVITSSGGGTFTYPNNGPNATLGAGVATASPMPSLQVGMSVEVDVGTNQEAVYVTEVFPAGKYQAQPGFVANFGLTHASLVVFFSDYISGNVAANTTATITKHDVLNVSFPSTQTSPDANYIQLYVLASNPLAVSQITLQFDVGDGTFAQDYYSKAVQMSPAQTVASGTSTASSAQTQAVALRAAGGVQVETLGGGNTSLLPADYPLLQQLQPASLNPGNETWTLVQVPLSQFVQNGAAGSTTNNWANVVAWRIQIQTNPTLATAIGFDDLVFVGGSDLNSFAGQVYDYRITYINLNTGCESNPSQEMVATDQTTFNSQTGVTASIATIACSVFTGAGIITCTGPPTGMNPGDTISIIGNSNRQLNRDTTIISIVGNVINTPNFGGLPSQSGTGGVVSDLTDSTPVSAFLPIPLAVQQQGIEIQAQASPDPQVTHWNLYRRGGSLTQAWYFVAQTPIATLTYVDVIADSIIEINNQLLIDSDPPVTSLLPTPLSSTLSVTGGSVPVSMGPGFTTVQLTSGTVYPGQFVIVDVGALQEECYVQAVAGSNVTLYLQFLHGTSAGSVPFTVPITATTRPQMPMNLCAIAFDQAFLAGDPNNPHVLYYSRTYAPETFPSENFIEVGTPDSPIMALVVLRGFLYVFTTKTVWQIYGGSGATPVAIPTGVMHGMAASFAWACSENVVYYLSYDGVYAFTGSGSQYLTQNTEWIWTSRTETNGVIPVLNPAAKTNVIMAYGNHECFVAYQDSNNITHRQIASDSYSRWRNDDQLVGNITAMFFEQDTGQLIVGKDDGMVYIDQINDYDSAGWGAGGEIKNAIAINLQTPQLDLGVPKAFKNFAEVTVDATLPAGLIVTVTALFDSQATTMVLGTITGTGARVQYQLNVQNALGYRSLNMGLKLTGNTTAQAIFNEIHVRAVIEAEERVGYDSYKLDFGSASWKLWKQAWFVYAAPDPAGIEMAVYIDENPIPSYIFTLPQTLPSSIRTTVKVRFPALKGRIIRLVGTSESPFQMYTKDTEVEYKLLDAQKGYAKMALST
jgi:hypothetical protein